MGSYLTTNFSGLLTFKILRWLATSELILRNFVDINDDFDLFCVP